MVTGRKTIAKLLFTANFTGRFLLGFLTGVLIRHIVSLLVFVQEMWNLNFFVLRVRRISESSRVHRRLCPKRVFPVLIMDGFVIAAFAFSHHYFQSFQSWLSNGVVLISTVI